MFSKTLFLFSSCWLMPMSSAQICFPGTPCISTVTSQSTPSIVTRLGLPSVEPCPNGKSFCGDDPRKYPHQDVKNILNRNLDDSSPTKQRFFHEPRTSSNLDFLDPACSVRIELIPRFGRAKNLEGKWRYLVEGGPNEVQQHEVTLCVNSGSTCQTDTDSPRGPETTKCKQVYRTEKLLATDENGELLVDSFSLPSACVCHFVDNMDFLATRSQPVLKTGQITQRCELKASNLERALQNNIRASGERLRSSRPTFRRITRLREKLVRSLPSACRDSAILCEDKDETYPFSNVANLLRNDQILADSQLFDQVFGPTCKSPETETTLGDGIRLKTGFSFDLREEALCSSRERYIFPEKAKNVNSQWRFVINIPSFRQGVTVIECASRTEDMSCKYGGQAGNYPYATTCKQMYSVHSMLALSEDGSDIYVDKFRIPSACICHIIDRNPFI